MKEISIVKPQVNYNVLNIPQIKWDLEFIAVHQSDKFN